MGGCILKKIFMDGCDYLEDIYGWVWLFRAHLPIGMSSCDCLKHIYV